MRTQTLELALVRFNGTQGYTAGKLYADGTWICNTLEDEVREIEGKPVSEWKIRKETAIPRGRYEVKLTRSPRFGRILPEIVNVPGFTGIRIHRGNKVEHTEGCPLVGMVDGNDRDAWAGNSTTAERLLIDRINIALVNGKRVFITVV